MIPTLPSPPPRSAVDERAEALFREQLDASRRGVDRLFVALLLFEWAGAIVEAVLVSPLTWAGATPTTHIHVWAALVLGGLTVSLPVALALVRPGEASTRHGVAASQMLMSALLIHLSGGRIEVHFHIFGSLAFLALYRDSRVLATAGLVVAVDHYARGAYWPVSVFGVPDRAPFRWLEHALWVVFEGSFLALGIRQSLRLSAEAARGRAEVEASRDRVERAVAERTAELERANADLLAEVAERCRAEASALRARAEAEEATRSKSQFLANMSHEIRTPMNAIIGMTELTLGQGQGLDPSHRDNLEVVRLSAESLLRLIDDILDLSKIEAGKLELEPIPFRPRDVVAEAIRTLHHRASSKGLTLTAQVDPDVPDAAVGDPLRLRQVLLNLVGNAIKFTHRGRVEVRVGVEPDGPGTTAGPGSRTLRFSVVDDGIGIPEGRRAAIFDPFRQADGSTTRKYGGTGLGLSISAGLVARMGGRIWVDSEPGRGSAFHFTARFALATSPGALPGRPTAGAIPRPSRALRVLLVDDNEINRKVGMMMVRRLGHEVETAVDGPDALARHESRGPFDLILMDVQMPVMDGFEATARLRQAEAATGRRTPIVALTAHAMDGDRGRCLDAGMDEHLAKPIRLDGLARVIRDLVGDPRPGPGPVAEEEEESPGGPASTRLDPAEVRPAPPPGGAEVADRFRRGCAERLDEIRRAIQRDNPTELARTARALAGSLGLFATEATIGLASEIESAGPDGRAERAGRTLVRLEGAIAGMQTTLDHLAGLSA